ncbi:hypothetical protein [Rathayibacter soli]|uniref:hypothetical protein n=1 Tax=Rathayibacter soli TaxID=3144168 RepID=UPI0027E463DA|nr:hypothetical protein [Glaciibacter superstes]
MMRRRSAGLVGLAAILLMVTTGCTTAQQQPARHPSSATVGTSVANECPVTPATRDGIPPALTQQGYGAVFGSGNLWVGAWWQDPQALEQARSAERGDPEYPYGYKYPTWTLRQGEVTDAGGAPRITVKALDRQGRGTGSTGGYATSTTPGDSAGMHWWPTVLGVSARGCWQVTQTVGNDSISYVVEI